MAFERRDDGWIESDEGFGVRFEGVLKGFRYREGDRTIRVVGEWLMTGFMLETQQLGAWDPPHEHEPVPRHLVATRVKEAMASRGTEVFVDDT